MNILVINAGSSSLKYQLLNPDSGVLLAKGLCERIGIDGKFTYKPQAEGKEVLKAVDVAMPTHSEAIQAVLNALVDPKNGVVGSMKEIDAVGHRVVHGGEAFAGSVLITDEVMKALEDCIPLAPLHNPANITGINACTAVMGKEVPQVAVFDTAFHQTMPPKAYMYALPHAYYEKDKVRRYGFHGTSHKYVSTRAAAMLGKKPEEVKLISCHLGNGSSVAAVDGGKSVDTSMGFTPLAGVPMGTRSGDVDAGILQYLMNKYGMDIDQMLDVLNKKSGVEGLSGVSSDFRDLENAAEEGNELAILARDKFAYEVKKYVGAYAAAMGGVDAIIFTAGVGENDGGIRTAICQGLEFMGVKMDPATAGIRGEEAVLSAPDSSVKVLLIPTNEELMIAMDTAAIASGK
ncbi:acetate kinase [Dysosmobacter sp. NSJ-60]|uniref:Acetate kinase n=1 Tax=Pusillibacter faecalis TaxID=2714358 RepID=A0A810Q5R2_9FIRM|nr:acetate kinase [Pusillibacter faecalis]MBC5748789.1 acetate kinase [Dysosmobacter hominis]MCQ5026854.1 acetate kinase [Oscillibacter valericigenes]BCK83324.1 acetate kinase [Pusillibacter faecalis]